MDENRMPRRGSSQCLPKRELEWAKQEKEEPYLGFIGRSTKGDTVIDGALRTVYRTRNARRTFLLSVFFANSLRLLLFPSGSCNGPHPMLPEKRRPEVCVCVSDWLIRFSFRPQSVFLEISEAPKLRQQGGQRGVDDRRFTRLSSDPWRRSSERSERGGKTFFSSSDRWVFRRETRVIFHWFVHDQSNSETVPPTGDAEKKLLLRGSLRSSNSRDPANKKHVAQSKCW